MVRVVSLLGQLSLVHLPEGRCTKTEEASIAFAKLNIKITAVNPQDETEFLA